uniref:Exonuclease domain-containing protein n=1 Tax=Ascaris lumbricoides TaxID=6252 RepID=A0A0M3ICX6_ASCLU
MNISGIVQKTSENIKKKRKLKRLKKNINEILLLSGKDPSDDFHIDELPPEPNSSKEMDISMRISRKLHSIREEIAPPPQVEFRLHCLRGSRLGSQHLAQLAHRTVSSTAEKPPWLNIKPYKGIIQTVFVRIDTDLECVEYRNKDSFIEEFFGRKCLARMQKEVANRNEFWNALLNVPISRVEQIKEIVAKKYYAITADSPIFAIDCEMCVTKAGSRELTRITLVDEECNVVIDTLVKPYDEIVDYVTKFSGITKQMLDPIDVRLEHVQVCIIYLSLDMQKFS